MAMNTHRQLGVNTNMSQKSIEKLSSGFRINRAGDDAAGLAISEKMRGQIRGLTQASRNAQDGISLIQTAEGALNETHAILQRMRELAVQSATDTNTDDDRIEIQKEINQLSEEITRISTDTEFNTMKLLDGTYNGKIFHIGANENQSVGIQILDMSSAELKVGELAIEGTDIAKIGEATLAGGVDAVAAVTGVDGAAASLVHGDLTITAVAEGSAGNAISVAFVDPGSGSQDLEVVVSANNTTITVNLATNTGGDITSTVNDIVNVINTDNDAKVLVEASGAGDDPVTAADAAPLTDGVTAVDAVEAVEEVKASVVLNGITFTAEATGASGNALSINIVAGAAGEAFSAVESSGVITVTLAANTNGEITTTVNELVAGFNAVAGLGVKAEFEATEAKGIDVSTQVAANEAITTIDDAIVQVSAERSKLGAIQNRLEHTIKNLDTSAENLQASESRIRDVDMAKEIMEFTKQNILQQAATAMLAQANMAPQSVLQLLG